MKLFISQIPQRFLSRPFKMEGIASYGLDNCYPQAVNLLINSSGRAKSVTSLYAKFIEGKGFNDKNLWKLKVNADAPRALTMDKLHRDVAKDFSVYRGFAIHVNWNANFQWTELHFVPFEYCRLTPADNYGIVPKVAIYSNWDRVKSRKINKADITFIDFWNPDPKVIQAQVDAAGGWDEYKGQVLWYSLDGRFTYPFCSLESVIEDVDSDSQSKIYKNNNIRTDFLAAGMLVHGKSEEDAGTRKDRITPTFGPEGGSSLLGWDNEYGSNNFSQRFQQFQGAERASKIIDVETDGDVKDALNYVPFDTKIKDNLFQFTETSIQNNIRKSLCQPSILLSDEIAGKLGNSSEVDDACNFYNGVTESERRLFEEIYTEIFETNGIGFSGDDFTVIPMQLITSDTETTLEILGSKGATAINDLLSGTLQPQQKINTLIVIYGLTQEEAEAMVNGTPLKSVAA